MVLGGGILLYMGFFSKLFSSKPDIQPLRTGKDRPAHTENWAPYRRTVDDATAQSIIVDLGLTEIAPVKERPFCLRIDVIMHSPDEHGMISSEEFEVLSAMDDAFESGLAVHGVTYAGRISGNGKIAVYLYASEPAGIEQSLTAVMAQFPQYKYEHIIDREDGWNSYFHLLYPEPIELRTLHNSLVIDNLQKHGDKLEKARLVEHWVYFSTESDRNKFLESIKGQGFKTENGKVPNTDKPFQLKLAREDKVDHDSVDTYILDLWQKARDVGGEYDGWETFIVKE